VPAATVIESPPGAEAAIAAAIVAKQPPVPPGFTQRVTAPAVVEASAAATATATRCFLATPVEDFLRRLFI
jgi:hypothetical protein